MASRNLSETDVCTKLITPALVKSGWDIKNQIRQEKSFIDGRIIVKGENVIMGEKKRADYILYHKPNIPIAIIEAKDEAKSVGAGLQQAIEYGTILDMPFIYSSNGHGFIEHDITTTEKDIEHELSMEEFPSPDDLWERYKKWKGIKPKHEEIITQDYHVAFPTKKPRYYQEIAINRTVEAVAKGQNRILLVMATGTGKTYVASQIIFKLWKAKAKKRILFLADRNVLIDQAINNDFKVFKGVMTKVTHRKVDTSYEIYAALYQGVSGNEDYKNIYKQFSKDFFDLIVVDECHRGSAAIDSAWREILEYFSSATQIGLTATPKETKEISNIDYFGEPIYKYSLKQGIEDGFLAPYKVVRVSIDKDVEGWRPIKGKRDKYGYEVPDRIYNVKDFDRNLVIDERTWVVANKVSEFLKNTNRFDKTIVFCVDIDHANRMRMALANINADLVRKNPKYVVKITGDDDIGKKEVDNFIDPATKYPVIATTSKLLNTGVDAQTCKLIVLDSIIHSMTEFKQIIGRGTRIREDYNKFFFTIIDFRQVTDLFADPEFDGEPVQIYEAPIDTELDIIWSDYGKLRNFDRKLLKKMFQAGCRKIVWGLESGSDTVLKRMCKGFTSSQASEILWGSHQAGIWNQVHLMAGFPHESLTEKMETIDFIRTHKDCIDEISPAAFHLHNGSIVYRYPEKFGIMITGQGNQLINDSNSLFKFDEIGGLSWDVNRFEAEQTMRDMVSIPGKRNPVGIEVLHLYQKFHTKDKVKEFVDNIINDQTKRSYGV